MTLKINMISVSMYNDMLKDPNTIFYRKMFYGYMKNKKVIEPGLVERTRELLREQGVWDHYLGVNFVFLKIQKALDNIVKKLGIVYGY